MSCSLDRVTREALFSYLLRLGDDRLVLGHRLSEWCGHAPILEEDIALANIALDCIGQAANFLSLAGEVEGEGRSEDDLAYFRDTIQFRNHLLVEQPNGDFANTLVRQFFLDVYLELLYEALAKTGYQPLVAIAEKSLKEVKYHLRHSAQWVLRLGDGTEESHRRTQEAVDLLWSFTGELFSSTAGERLLVEKNFAVNCSSIHDAWSKTVIQILEKATLKVPSSGGYMHSGGQVGKHTEHLGYILAEMQILPRSYPDAQW